MSNCKRTSGPRASQIEQNTPTTRIFRVVCVRTPEFLAASDHALPMDDTDGQSEDSDTWSIIKEECEHMFHQDHKMDDIECEVTQYEHYLEAELSRQSLGQKIEQLDRVFHPATAPAEIGDIERILQTAKDALAAQKAALDGVLEHITPQSRRCTETAALTAKLTSTPELLELILLQLSNSDLLKCMQVNRLFLDAVNASARVQRKMGLREDVGGKVYFPTHDFWFSDLFCTAQALEPKAGEDSENMLRIHVVVETLPRKIQVGDRCRRMLICQPPLTSIQAYTSCCAGPRFWRYRVSDERPPAETINREKGITVGDVLDATDRLKQGHRLCPDASPFDHNADGNVNPQVFFEATMRAEPDDPLYVRERERMDEDKRKHKERVARQHRIDAYAAAKRAARDRGNPIPTLVEFEAASARSNT